MFRVVTQGEPEEDFVNLSPLETEVLLKRATKNLDELIDFLTQNTVETEKITDATTDVTTDTELSQPTQSNTSIEVEWTIDDNVISEKAQESIIMLVGAGILFSLKDLVDDFRKAE